MSSCVWCAYECTSVHVSVGTCMHTTACMWRLEISHSVGISPPLTRYRNSVVLQLCILEVSGLWASGEFFVSISNPTVKMLGPHISNHLYKFQLMPAYATTYTPIHLYTIQLRFTCLDGKHFISWTISTAQTFFICLSSFCYITTISSFTPLSSWSYFVYNIDYQSYDLWYDFNLFHLKCLWFRAVNKYL